MNTVTSNDGTSIAFEQTGTGPTLILIDPAGGFHGWRPIQEAIPLLAEAFTVVTYDRRGRGHSTEMLPYAPEREVDDLAALIAATGGEAFLYGFSSGAVLALLAGAHGLPVEKMVLLEPPLEVYDALPPATDLEQEVAALIAKGQRREAYTHFSESIGVPPEIIESTHQSLYWPDLEKMAHTIVYDLTIIRSLTTPQLATIPTPTLVISSEATGPWMGEMARSTAQRLPNSEHRVVNGDWHGVSADVLAPMMIAFFNDQPTQEGAHNEPQ